MEFRIKTQTSKVPTFHIFGSFLVILFFSTFYFLISHTALAATFVFTPAAGVFQSGDRFTVNVSIDSQGTPINSAEGALSFNNRYLSVEQISTDVSIFKFWVEQPTFDNSAGTISFGGGLPNPGFNGSNGKLFSIIFDAAGTGNSALNFTSGDILANDGMGTNVFRGGEPASYQITIGSGTPKAAPIQITSNAALLPVVTSVTHPDQNQWYATPEFKAAWVLPDNVTGVNYALYSNPNYNLGVTSRGLIGQASYDLKDLADGVWHFLVRFNSADGWGPVLKRLVKIDREPPPPFQIMRVDSTDPTNPQPVLHFVAIDDTSGIAGYQMKIGDGDWQTVSGGDYTLPLQAPGGHDVLVQALDGAGNAREASTTVDVRPIGTPAVDSYSKTINVFGQALTAAGTTLPNTQVVGYLKASNAFFQFQTTADKNGEWQVAYRNRFPGGDYALTFLAKDDRGALSLETTPLPVHVAGGWQMFWTSLKQYWVLILSILLGLVFLGSLAYLFYFRRLFAHCKIAGRLEGAHNKINADLADLRRSLKGVSPSVLKELTRLEKDIDSEFKKIKNGK